MNHSKLNEIFSNHNIYDLPKLFSVFHHCMMKKGFPIDRGGAKQPTLGEGVAVFFLEKVVFFLTERKKSFYFR